MAKLIELDMSHGDEFDVPTAGNTVFTPQVLSPVSAFAAQTLATHTHDSTVMAHNSKALRSLDFRLSYRGPGVTGYEAGEQPCDPRHWLLGVLYGRDLLKGRLAQLRPDLQVSEWRHQPELDDLLDAMVDDLGLRDWSKPRSIAQWVGYLRKVLSMKLDMERSRNVSNGTDAPTYTAS
jgi:hypothetical protein